LSDGETSLGDPVSGYGSRASFETVERVPFGGNHPENSASFTPLADCHGIITPSALHFERHHAGIPDIDPAEHRLMIHGLVERPLVFTMAEIEALPSVSRIQFLECSGNSGSEWAERGAPDVQRSHGLSSCSEWTGVPLGLLLAEAGVRSGAEWILAEGADACKMARSLPLEKGLDDVLLAYGQNGEALRPEQGYPLRLLVPGWEGNVSIKWLRRLELTDRPYMFRDETSHYTDLMPDGTARQFTFAMEAKSVITHPSGRQMLAAAGFVEVSGLAWSGRGRIVRVEVSVDGGESWQEAELQEPRLSKAFTRFRLPWSWNGQESVLRSRATDETGYVQPVREALVALRGAPSRYHYNGQTAWRILADGSVVSAVT